MKKLLPSHAKNIQQYKSDKVPLFIQHKIEAQIEKMHESTVMLPSGGSIVINPTEALVSIDINSGKATRERHIEETALNTNLEAAAEIARQVRLRDLAGLVVIDFIDMDDRRHVAQVERKVRESFKNDRARVQMGKISPFGLLELSRQRLRPSMLETSSQPCPHCHATGHIRSTESMALLILRSLEEEGIVNRSLKIKAVVPTSVAFYILNEKRKHLADIEARHHFSIVIEGDHSLIAPHFRMIQLERSSNASGDKEDGIEEATVLHDSARDNKPLERSRSRSSESSVRERRPQRRDDPSNDDAPSKDKDEGGQNKRRSNQNRRRGNKRPDHEGSQGTPNTDKKPSEDKPQPTSDGTPLDNADRKRRRSGRRRSGGHRNRPDQEGTSAGDVGVAAPVAVVAPAADKPTRKTTSDVTKSEAVKKVASRIIKNAPIASEAATPAEKPAGKKAAEKAETPTPRKRKSWLKKLLE
jgi:ribonuclease E